MFQISSGHTPISWARTRTVRLVLSKALICRTSSSLSFAVMESLAMALARRAALVSQFAPRGDLTRCHLDRVAHSRRRIPRGNNGLPKEHLRTLERLTLEVKGAVRHGARASFDRDF